MAMQRRKFSREFKIEAVRLLKESRVAVAQALRARPRRRGLPKDDGLRLVTAIAPNVLDRQFAAARPNQKWIADLTYLWTAKGWLYVAAVIDLYSRRVVGWSMKPEMTARLVTDALVMAIRRRGKPDALLHHSDQGSQYTSEQFQRLMADNGVICPMSRSGNVWDNAAMKSFFSSLKIERTARKTYRSRDAALTKGIDPEALEMACKLIDKIIVSPPKHEGDPPETELVGDLTQMLITAARPNDPRTPSSVDATVLAAFLSSVKGNQGWSSRLFLPSYPTAAKAARAMAPITASPARGSATCSLNTASISGPVGVMMNPTSLTTPTRLPVFDPQRGRSTRGR